MSRERELLHKLRGYVHWVSKGKATLLSKDKEMLDAIDAILSQPEAELDVQYEVVDPKSVKIGDKLVLAFPLNGMTGDQKILAESGLRVGQVVTLLEKEVGSWSSTFWVSGAKSYPLNSVFFGAAKRPERHTASPAEAARHKGETPDTDTLMHRIINGGSIDRDVLDAFRAIERQRDELRAENERLRAQIGVMK